MTESEHTPQRVQGFFRALADMRSKGPGDPKYALPHRINTARRNRERIESADMLSMPIRAYNADYTGKKPAGSRSSRTAQRSTALLPRISLIVYPSRLRSTAIYTTPTTVAPMTGDELTRPPQLYQQIAARLRDAINDGTYRPGDQLPGETHLGQHYSVTRDTLRQAISLLKDEGLLDVEQGRGTFVRRPPMMMRFNRYLPAKRIPERGPFEQTCADLGIEGYEELVLVEQIPATDAVATALGIDLNATVVHRRTYMHAGRDIVQIQDSYFDLQLIAGAPLANPEKLIHGVYASLDAIGQHPDSATEALGARMPTYSETSILQLQSGVPVIEIHRTTFSKTNHILEWLKLVAAADRNLFSYDRLPLPN
jgi:GntR family transcriptional regulator